MEYKIFFDKRVFVISDNEEHCFNSINGMGIKASVSDMAKLIDYFEHTTQLPELWMYAERPKVYFKEFARCNKLIAAAGGLVHNSKDELLLIYRNNYWDLPKGKVEKGETLEAAALREVGEECGIPEQDLRIVSFITDTYHVYALHNKRILKQTSWFNMSYHGHGALIPQTEEQIEKAEWVGKSMLSEHFDPMYVSIKEVFSVVE